MLFGARLTFEKNPTFLGGFTLRVRQGRKPLYRISVEMPQDVLEAIDRQGGLINAETGSIDKAFNDAILQWCIRETEERIRDGQFDEKPSNIIAIQVTAADIPSVMFFRREKSCDYQRLIGRKFSAPRQVPRISR
jgi:hypothetical protein